MALQILKHAFLMIFRNFGQALRVSVGPFLIGIAIVTVLFSALGMPMSGAQMNGYGHSQAPGPAMLLLVILFPALFFILGWIAVSWHRFILLEEYSGFLPAVSGRPIWAYVWKSIQLGLIIFLTAIPVLFVVGLLSASLTSTGMGGTPLVALLVLAGASVLLSFVWLRLAICLPATAVGKSMRFGEAWSATAKLSGTIFGVCIILVLINFIPNQLIAMISRSTPIIGGLLQIAIEWLTVMLGVSILTTLYGHVVEGRDLAE